MSNIIKNLHYGFTVSDLARTRAFFCDCMGFEVQKEGRDPQQETEHFVGVRGADLNYCVLKAPDHTIEIMQYSGPPERRRLDGRPCDVGFSHLCYLVDDLDSFIEKAAKFRVFPVNPPLTFPDYRVRGIYMRDPDGLTIEVIQNLSSE